MFVEEIKEKLKAGEETRFVATILGERGIYVSGVKTVILTSQNETKLSVKKGVLRVLGEKLKLSEIGGGDVYIIGEVESVEIEKEKR